jgi:UDP-glucose:(heptosyl)LPS alpha-1,3-glucosyltransferase
MKVAVIIERYDISLGGAEWLVYELVSALSQLGLEVEVLAAKATADAPNTHVLCEHSSNKRISLAFFTKALRQHLSANHFDIVHSLIPLTFADVYQPPGGSFAETIIRNAASYNNRFRIFYKKATAFTNRRRNEAMSAEKNLCNNPEGPIVAALSEYVKQQFQRHYNLEEERIVVIPNGVGTDRKIDPDRTKELKSEVFQNLRTEQQTNPVFFLFGANNFRLKGLGVLIKALSLASKSDLSNTPYLLIAGSGKPEKYKNLAKRLGIANRLIFLGFQSNIQNALAISDVAVLPTFYDPSSRYILEALAAGKPVITTRFNGATDLFVNNRHGKVIESAGDISALAEAIVYFTDTNNIQKASQAIVEDNIEEKISIHRAAKQLVEVYESILQKKGRK